MVAVKARAGNDSRFRVVHAIASRNMTSVKSAVFMADKYV